MACSALYDSEWLESHRNSKYVRSLPELKRMLEGDELKTLRPDERCVLWLELLCGQVCIVRGEIEAAQQLLTDGFATSQQAFGTGDVLTMEFQTMLAEVYFERREIELAIPHIVLNPELVAAISGRSDIFAITAITLAAKFMCILGSLDEADSLLKKCLNQTLKIVGGDHSVIWRIRYDIIEMKLGQEDYATAEKYLRELRDLILEAKGPEHLDALHVTLHLAWLKLLVGDFEEAEQICQALLVQQRKRHADNDDRITFTKAVLWVCHLQSGRIDSEGDLENDLLKSLENGSMPNPQLVRRWETVALLAEELDAVDVASALKKHYDKAMELAFGVEYLQAMEQDEASPEDSNNGLVARIESLAIDALREERMK